MIGTAFYALGVIACMILIVLALALFIVNFELAIGLVFLLALLWWLGVKQALLLVVVVFLGIAFVIVPMVGGLQWLNERDIKKRIRRARRVQDERWKALDERWKGM